MPRFFTTAAFLSLSVLGWAEELGWVSVPFDLFEPAPRSLFSRLGNIVSVGSEGSQAVALTQNEEGKYFLVNFRAFEVLKTTALEPPGGANLVEPRLEAKRGDLALLRNGGDLCLFRDGKFVETIVFRRPPVGAELVDGAMVFFLNAPPFPGTGGEEPLVVLRELSNGQEDVLLRAPQRRAPADPASIYATVDGVATTSGELWTVGVYSGEVRRFNRAGKVVRRTQLPISQGQLTAGDQERMKAELQALVPADATQRPPAAVNLSTPTQRRVVQSLGLWGSRLVVVLKNTTPDGLIAVLPQEPEKPWFFRLPQPLRGADVAVTGEGLWFRTPLGLIRWAALEEFLARIEEQ